MQQRCSTLLRRVPRPLAKALACVEDVPLAEMWSQGVFIDRRHGLAVVDLVLQHLVSLANLLAASDRIKSQSLFEENSSLAPWTAPWAARTCWTVWTARMEVVGPGRWPGRSWHPQNIRVLRMIPAVASVSSLRSEIEQVFHSCVH